MASGSIRPMSAETAHNLVTGQVIASLSGAVKEMIENALDANPTDIEVVVGNKGADLLEVRDSGSGIRPEDFPALAKPHSTSKLSCFGDLEGVQSFGFRGEALNALALLGDLEMSTRHESQSVAHRLRFDAAGTIIEDRPCARQVGTTVSVRNLFHALPVRRKELLKSAQKEWRGLLSTVTAFALIASPVRFVLRDTSRKESLLSCDGKGLSANAARLLGDAFSSLLPLSLVRPGPDVLTELGASEAAVDALGMGLSGLMSSYEQGSSSQSRDKQFLFINRRPCEFPKARKLLNDLYRQYKKGSRHGAPVFILDITLPTERIDVNASADKREVLVSEERAVLAVIKASAAALMEDAGAACPSLPTATQVKVETAWATSSAPGKENERTPAASAAQFYPPLAPTAAKAGPSKSLSLEAWRFSATKRSAVRPSPTKEKLPRREPQAPPVFIQQEKTDECEPEGEWRLSKSIPFDMQRIKNARERAQKATEKTSTDGCNFSAALSKSQDAVAEAELTRSLRRSDFGRMRVVGQFNLGFIIAQLDERELFVVDQHASDEKATFEGLQQNEEIESQRLISPRELSLTSLAEGVVIDNEDILRKNGFTFAFDHSAPIGKRVQLSGFPLIGGLHFDQGDLEELIAVLSELPGLMYRPARFARVFASRACRSSVMIGTALRPPQMDQILRNLSVLKQPWNCPHGRPTLRHLATLDAPSK